MIRFMLFLSIFLQTNRSATFAAPSDSVFAVRSTWHTSDAKPFVLEQMKGNYFVVAMIYTGCAHACPMTISKLQKLDRELTEIGLKDVKFVLASFDVARDTPAALSAYAKGRKIDTSKYTFLSPPNDRIVRELAAVLDVSYKKLENGEFSHNNRITLFGPEGVRVYSLDGLSTKHDDLLVEVKKRLQK